LPRSTVCRERIGAGGGSGLELVHRDLQLLLGALQLRFGDAETNSPSARAVKNACWVVSVVWYRWFMSPALAASSVAAVARRLANRWNPSNSWSEANRPPEYA